MSASVSVQSEQNAEAEILDEASASYQETEEFCTWRKHVRCLYQQLFHIDLVWESTVSQFMPFVTKKGGVSTGTLLTATRTNGREQCYLQLLNAMMPEDTESLDSSAYPYSEATGEIGGYGMAPSQCGLKIERRILHEGDVLAARYMYANPLVLASCSSDGSLYVFDWSRVSLNKYPNDPPRPRAPLAPNEPNDDATDEERASYDQRMRELKAIAVEQDRWDQRTGKGQHVLQLTGGTGPSDNLDWNTQMEGLLVSGSQGRSCVWQVGNMSKDEPKEVKPIVSFALEDDDARVTSVCFSWQMPSVFISSSTSGAAFYNDVRSGEATEMFSLPSECTAVSLSQMDGNSVIVGDEQGSVHLFDLRNSSVPVHVEQLHTAEVTTLQWCPHSRHLFASGSVDTKVCIYNITTSRLLFKHAGHTDTIMDLGWNYQDDSAGQLISTDSNATMVWRPRDRFFVA